MTATLATPRQADVAAGNQLLDESEALRGNTIRLMGLDETQAAATEGHTELIERTFPAIDAAGLEYGEYVGFVALTNARNPITGKLRERGEYKGGIRLNPLVCGPEVSWLSRGMLDKLDLFDLPLEGGKAGILVPEGDTASSLDIMRGFALAFRDILGSRYVGATDIGTYRPEMLTVEQSLYRGCVTGTGALEGQSETTGFGLAVATKLMSDHFGHPLLPGSTVAVHGFGKLGTVVARFLMQFGCRVQLVADQHGGVANENGLDINALINYVGAQGRGGSVVGFPSADSVTSAEVLKADVDVLELASTENVVNLDNAHLIDANVVGVGANGGIQQSAESRVRGHKGNFRYDSAAGVLGSHLEMRLFRGLFQGGRDEVLSEVRQSFQVVFGEIISAMERYDTDFTHAIQCVTYEKRLRSLGMPLDV